MYSLLDLAGFYSGDFLSIWFVSIPSTHINIHLLFIISMIHLSIFLQLNVIGQGLGFAGSGFYAYCKIKGK